MSQVTREITEREAQKKRQGALGLNQPQGCSWERKLFLGQGRISWRLSPSKVTKTWTKRIREQKLRSPSLHLPLEPAKSPRLAVLPKETQTQEQAKPPAAQPCAGALQAGARLAKRRGQVPARLCRAASWNVPFPLCTSGLSLPTAVPHRPLSKPRDTGGRVLGHCWCPGAAGQVSQEGAAASGVGGLGSTLCSWPQLAGGHRKKLSPPSFIFLASCVLDVPLKGPLKQHKLPQTLSSVN